MKKLWDPHRYDQQNLESAAIILADPAKYPEGSIQAVWAAAFMATQRKFEKKEAA